MWRIIQVNEITNETQTVKQCTAEQEALDRAEEMNDMESEYPVYFRVKG